MAKMIKPQAEAVRFAGGGIDVIATSGNPTLTLSGFANPDRDDASASLGNAGNYNTNYRYEIEPNMNDYLGIAYVNHKNIWVKNGVNESGLGSLFNNEHYGKKASWADGTYTYDPTNTTNNYIWFIK